MLILPKDYTIKREAEKSASSLLKDTSVQKFNPHHDPKTGRFTSKYSGLSPSGARDLVKSLEEALGSQGYTHTRTAWDTRHYRGPSGGGNVKIRHRVGNDTNDDVIEVIYPSALDALRVTRKFNPHHDPKDGKFTSGPGGTSTTETEAQTDAKDLHDKMDRLNKGEKIDIPHHQVRDLLEAAAAREDHPDLTDVHVEGMLIFGGNGLGLTRDQMPQIPGEHREQFIAHMRDNGVGMVDEHVNPLTLFPAQSEISANRVGKMYANKEKVFASDGRAFVSEDHFVLDGHHRWATHAAEAIYTPKIKLPVTRVMTDHGTALKMMLEYNEKHGIKAQTLEGKKVTKQELLVLYGYVEKP